MLRGDIIKQEYSWVDNIRKKKEVFFMKSNMSKVISLLLICSIALGGCSKEASVDTKKNVKSKTEVTKKPMEKLKETKVYLDSLDGYKGAYYTKKYRNVFEECGYTDDLIDAKLQTAWDMIFNGTEDTKIYYESGKDEAYILDTGNNDVRSEGMSYGMMMCVQMDKQKEFDKIWKWAKTHMQIEDGQNKGYFRWSMHPSGTANSDGPAPDGEEYFAMALFFASHRWGDKDKIYNYSKEARYILHQAINQEKEGTGSNMWDTNNHLIRFVPGIDFSDPSYHLPHFYELFALWADEDDRAFYKEAAKASREYLKLACNKDTGLAAEYATYEGEPKFFYGGHDIFASDSFRVAGNIALDYSWFAADPWEIEQSNRLQAFFMKEGINDYYSAYKIDGKRIESGNYHALGLVSMNAMASLAGTGKNTRLFVSNLWSKEPANGRWRYYDDCLYFFSLLALSGNYRIY